MNKHTQTDNLDPVLSATLDQWEVEPVSLDFNRRLFQRIRELENRGYLTCWIRYAAPAVLLFLILYCADGSAPSAGKAVAKTRTSEKQNLPVSFHP